jgi:hypothetical protein
MILIWMTPGGLVLGDHGNRKRRILERRKIGVQPLCCIAHSQRGDRKIVVGLEIHPEASGGAERFRKPESCISGDGPLAPDDLIDSHRSDSDAAGQLSMTHFHRV